MNKQNSVEYAALVLRVSLGVMFVAHALLKIVVFTPEGTAGFFASVGLPAGLAYPTMGAELIGGIMLLLGIRVRTVSLALVPILIGSIIFVHGSNGWGFSNEGGGWEYPLFLVMASIVQALLGEGAYSIKTVFNKRASLAVQA